MPWNRFLGSINVLKYGLRIHWTRWATLSVLYLASAFQAWTKGHLFSTMEQSLYFCTPAGFSFLSMTPSFFNQRGLIYTENNPLGRLCKMCKTFFLWAPSSSVCNSSSSAALLLHTPQNPKPRGLTLFGVFDHLSRRRGGEGQFCMW